MRKSDKDKDGGINNSFMRRTPSRGPNITMIPQSRSESIDYSFRNQQFGNQQPPKFKDAVPNDCNLNEIQHIDEMQIKNESPKYNEKDIEEREEENENQNQIILEKRMLLNLKIMKMWIVVM